MSRAVKVFFSLILFSTTAYGIGRGYNALSDGFSINNITYKKAYDPRWVVSLNPSARNSINEILSQPYSYLSKGHQSFVFESMDGKYVIKFLKCHLVEIKPWFAWLPLPPFLRSWREKRINSKQCRLEAIFRGWSIASEILPEETGILAVQMNPANTHTRKLQVKNKAGWEYDIDLNKTAYMIQRKVNLFIPSLQNLMSSNQTEQAQRLLRNLIDLYVHLCSLGISDTDPQIMRNTGVLDGKPILIDVGRLKKDPRVRIKGNCKAEILAKTRLFKKWLIVNYPDLASYFELEVASRFHSETDSTF